MKNNIYIVIIIGIIIMGVFFYVSKTDVQSLNEQSPTASIENSIIGCYVVNFNKDIYTLTVLSQQGESFKGTLVFKNFEKDSSSGLYIGTYKDGILLGDYSFNSEGMDSIMQVIFKKSGNDFIRGYGALNAEGNRFVDLNSIVYDFSSPLAVFKSASENCVTSL